MRIGIDIDGTIYPWTKAVNQALEQQYGIEGLVDHTHWDYLAETITKDQFAWIWTDEAAHDVFGRWDLIYPGAEEVINKLCNDHEVHFVTHRDPRRLTHITGMWLKYYFKSVYHGVFMLHNSVNKSELYEWDLFIDDKPQTIRELMEKKIPTVIPLRPWNEQMSIPAESLDNAHFLESWYDLEAML